MLAQILWLLSWPISVVVVYYIIKYTFRKIQK